MDLLRESIYTTSISEGNVYETLNNENNSTTVSNYVHNLANGIYREFESLISHYGENVVKNLMPMVVSCLETLDRVYSEKHNIEVEFELLKEDSGQLMKQYEREKYQRKHAEENLFRCEDNCSEIAKKYEDEIAKFKSDQKMHEIRLKNFGEQVSRYDKRDMERQTEFDKLLSRHHELIRFHKDYLEKSRTYHSETAKSFLLDKHDYKISNRLKFNSSTEMQRNSCSEIDSDVADSKPTESYENDMNLSEELGINTHVPSHQYDWEFNLSRLDEDICSDCEDISTGLNTQPLDDDLAGMRSEIESIIKENNDLIATKNALNIVKDDLISKLDEANSEIEILQHENCALNTLKTSLKVRIGNLETEIKSLKQEVLHWHHRAENEDDEENVPMSQRKKFTRLEMARVLMERNQYKEKLLELEEYVKWSKMLRNRKEKRLSIWERFSRLFKSNSENSNEKSKRVIHFQQDVGESVKTASLQKSRNESLSVSSGCSAVVDANRQQINGWSISSGPVLLTKYDLPTPIYSRPLLENNFGLKITSAVAVNITGGFTNKGNAHVGSSIFYGKQQADSLNIDLLEIEEKMNQGYCIKQFGSLNNEQLTSTTYNSESHVWICTSSDEQSQIIIVDANKPADYLEAFIIPNSPVLCLGSVPGAVSKDYVKKTFEVSPEFKASKCLNLLEGQTNDHVPRFKVTEIDCIAIKSDHFNSDSSSTLVIDDVTITRHSKPLPYYEPSACDKPSANDSPQSDALEFSSIQPTIWIGCQNGDLFVHLATGNRSLCLHHIRLSDSITNIIHQNSRVFVSLANGSIITFCRHLSDDNLIGQWNMSKYYSLEPENYCHSIRCIEPIPLTNKIWIGFRNHVLVLDDSTITITLNFEAHPRSDYTVRQLCCAGDGVWISLRLDTTLRLFHASNYQHLQDLNVEPYINKLLEPSILGLALLRITCLSTSCHRIWIGTNKGMIISAPFIKENKKETSSTQVETVNELLDNLDEQSVQENVCSPTFIPYIQPEDLQLSFHGHCDAVKFFVSVRANETKTNPSNSDNQSNEVTDVYSNKARYLIMSGGEGYKDFRIAENTISDIKCQIQKKSAEKFSKNNAHLIVWQLVRQKS